MLKFSGILFNSFLKLFPFKNNRLGIFLSASFLVFISLDLSICLIEYNNKFFVEVKALDTINDGSKNSKFSILELIMSKLLLVSFFNVAKKLHFSY